MPFESGILRPRGGRRGSTHNRNRTAIPARASNECIRIPFIIRFPMEERLSTHPDADSGPAIAVTDLRKVYDGKAAVDGLSLTVPRGCFFGFLGPNGAGKSTTIRMLIGLAAPTSGSIELLGLRMPEQELEIKKRIGLVPDENLLFDRLTGARVSGIRGPDVRPGAASCHCSARTNCSTCSNSRRSARN